MFEKVLIANRGEIAARIARTCARLSIPTVAVYSEPDAGAPHTTICDEAYALGGTHVGESYLDIDKILAAIRDTGATAVHPGYGLLSENADFVRALDAAGVTFVGPSTEAIDLMGDKAAARAFAAAQGVPVVPGSEGPVASDEEAVAFAEAFGYPLLVKASGGGGGIGMKVAKTEKKLRKAFAECVRRGESAFANPDVYLERYVANPRHIEVQIVADTHGACVHLFERECSVQRRHQKVIEEAPSPFVERTAGLREAICGAAVTLAQAAGYHNAGTVEFIVDEEGHFYFIEMNTRLQVEHPITEAITGLDIVELQLAVAAGEALPMTQADLAIEGHAIECRIYAENPAKKFMPAPGAITDYVEPQGEGVRVDSGVVANWQVTPYYDPLVSKVVAHGADRQEATARMIAALEGYTIGGLTQNIAMHLEVLASEAFVAGDFHTSWLESWYAERG